MSEREEMIRPASFRQTVPAPSYPQPPQLPTQTEVDPHHALARFLRFHAGEIHDLALAQLEHFPVPVAASFLRLATRLELGIAILASGDLERMNAFLEEHS